VTLAPDRRRRTLSPRLYARVRGHRRWGLVALVLFPLVVTGLLIFQNHAYWGTPRVPVVITATTPAGEMLDGRTTCHALRFDVVAISSGRRADFRDCRALFHVGERIAVGWPAQGSIEVDPHVMGPAAVAGVGLAASAISFALWLISTWDRRRRGGKQESGRDEAAA
jgi:hypothetical protein